MSRIGLTKKAMAAGRWLAPAIAGCVLATASLAWADGDHTAVPRRLAKKDHFVRDALDRMAYAEAYEITIVATCDCLEPSCPNGFMLSCGGEVEPPYAGFLTAVRRTSRQTCYVCACADFATLRATPVCID